MSQPDIIFIVLDTHRADRLGCYGYQKPISPNIDQFAAQSVLFEQAVSPAQWTIPSHASMFTGRYPTAHQVTQSSHALSPELPHVAEVLQTAGYETIGFCNNPLVGILNNGFKRGFETFYNYGGATPNLPKSANDLPWPLSSLSDKANEFLQRVSTPIQNFFGRSDLAFQISLNAWLTPLWSRLANFKGQNARSVQDVVRYLEMREQVSDGRPLFLFLNLMETHLPFLPPGDFIDQVAPYLRPDKEARDIMRRWNREAYRWAAPLSEPLPELEARVLSDLYDAEVAYQDDYLGPLFDCLNGRSNHSDTLTIVVSDHGDSMGEHNYFGHGFVAYEELVHVPLMMQWPQRLANPQRVKTPVSTRRVFHTILDSIGRLPHAAERVNPAEVHGLTLLRTIDGADPENGTAFSEVYPPLNFVKAIEGRQPQLIEPFRCNSLRRAVVREDEAGEIHKLIWVDDQPDELFNLERDRLELENLVAKRPLLTKTLDQKLTDMAQTIEQQRQNQSAATIDLEADEQLLQRLRGLGYIE
ncbi:MAG: sulfatase [Chloroflexota bacterium]